MIPRAAIVVCLLGLAAPAHAERRPFFEVEAGLVYGELDANESFTWDIDGSTGTYSVTGRGPGLEASASAGVRRGMWRFGGFARAQVLTIAYPDVAGGSDHTAWIMPVTIGPMVALSDDGGAYARADVGIGRLRSGATPDFDRFSGWGLLAVATELGFERQVSASWIVRPAVGLGGAWLDWRTDRDGGYHVDRHRLLTVSVMVSFVRAP